MHKLMGATLFSSFGALGGSQQRHQVRNQRNVRRWHRIILQPIWLDPRESLAFSAGDAPLPSPTDVKRHEQMEVGIGMAGEGQRRKTRFLDGDRELLAQFSNQSFLRPLARFDL